MKAFSLEVQRLEATLERRTLRVAADAVVTSVDQRTGGYADPANPVATVSEIDPLKIGVYLLPDAYPVVTVGARARITPVEPAGVAATEAVVTTKDPQIDASSRLFIVQLKMANPQGNILAGVRCSIRFLP
jgi:hypothetical protein